MSSDESGVHRLGRFEELLSKVATRSEENLRALYSSSCRSCSVPKERQPSTDEWESLASASKTQDDGSIATSSSSHTKVGCNHMVQGILEKIQNSRNPSKNSPDSKEKKIQKLEALNVELQSVVESLAQEKHLTRKEAKQELERTVATFYSQKELLRKQCDATELLNQHLERENDTLRKELTDLKDLVEESDLLAMEREMIGIEVPKQIVDMQGELEDLKQKLEAEQKLKLHYQSEVQELTKSLNNVPKFFYDQISDFSTPSDEGASEMMLQVARNPMALSDFYTERDKEPQMHTAGNRQSWEVQTLQNELETMKAKMESQNTQYQQQLDEKEETIAKLRQQCTSFQREIVVLKKKGDRKNTCDDTNRMTWALDCSGSSIILAEQLEEARCIIRDLQEELEETIDRNDQEVAILENTIQIVQAEETEKDREIQILKTIVQDLTKKLDSMDRRLDTVEHAEHLELLKEHKRRVNSRAPERPSESLRYDDDDSTISTVAKEEDSFEVRSTSPSDEQNICVKKEEGTQPRRRRMQGASTSTIKNDKQYKKGSTVTAARSDNAESALKSVETLQITRGSIESESFTPIINTKADVTFETTSTLPSSMDSPKRHIADEHVDESSPPNHVVTPDEHSDKGAIISRGQHGHSVEFTYYSSNLPSPDFEEHDEAISSLLKEIKSQDKIIKNLQGQIHSPRVITEPKVIHGRFDSPQKEAIAVTAHIMDLQEKLHFLARQVFESNQRIAGLEKDLRKKKQESAIIAEEDFMNYNSDRIHLHNAVSTLKGELRERDVQVAEIQKTIIENCSHPTTNTNGKSFDPSTSSNH